MSEKSPDDLTGVLREQGARYVVGTQGQPVAVLLTMDEYDHYLDLLDDEADSRDDELAIRLAQAAGGSNQTERLSFRDYQLQREGLDGKVQG